MIVQALLQELQQRQITLRFDGGELRYRAPKGVLTDDLRQAIRDHKPALLTLLSPTAPTIANFIQACCVFAQDIQVSGADLFRALATWRRITQAPPGEAVWQQLDAHLKAQGCTRSIDAGKVFWSGVALRPDVPPLV